MSQKSRRPRSLLDSAKNNVENRWSRPGLAERFADQEDFQTLKQIDYCLEVAARWCFLGKDIPPDTRIEIFVSNAVNKSEELQQLRKRVAELEEFINKHLVRESITEAVRSSMCATVESARRRDSERAL